METATARSDGRGRVKCMKLHTKLGIAAVTVVVIAGLVALLLPVLLPFLPSKAQAVLGGTITTVPGTVDELLEVAALDDEGGYGDIRYTHEQVDEEYVAAASIWPWRLPPGWGFPKNRGVADVPGAHWNGMGVQAAFSKWAATALDVVEAGDLEPDEANALLDELESATRILLDEGVLSDRAFIARDIEPLRQ